MLRRSLIFVLKISLILMLLSIPFSFSMQPYSFTVSAAAIDKYILTNSYNVQNDLSSSLITNLRVSSGRSYEISNCHSGFNYYTDRSYGIVSFSNDRYDGLDCVKTANNDKQSNSNNLIEFDLAADSKIYLYVDRRFTATKRPQWMREQWNTTGGKVYVSDSGAQYFDILSCHSLAGHIVLGGPHSAGGSSSESMYIVAVERSPGASRVCTTIDKNVYYIAGQVSNNVGVPVSGVTIHLNDGSIFTTDSKGNYGFLSLVANTYTVTPSKSGYSFSPASRTITLPPDQDNINFTATADAPSTYSISGVINEDGFAVAGINVSLSQNGIKFKNTTTDNSGRYTFSKLDEHGVYIVQPESSLYTFAPPFRSVTIPPDRENVDFTGIASPSTYNISGLVADNFGRAIVGATISDGVGHTTATDMHGNYGFLGLDAGRYVLTVIKNGYTFSPESLSITVPPDRENADFIGIVPPSTNKPPLVFVHGWNGFGLPDSCEWPNPKQYFDNIGDIFEAAGYVVTYASLETSTCYTPSLIENVPRLENAIALAKAATKQNKVILIAHSMGGLVSRAYIEGPSYENDVAALFTIGSPHLGVPSDLITFFANGISIGDYCANYQPAVCDFSEIGMLLFNLSHTRPEGVKYYLISGDAPFSSRKFLGRLTDGLIYGPDDGIVPTGSGLGLSTAITAYQKTKEVHSTVFGSQTYFTTVDEQSTSQTVCYLKTVLIDGKTKCDYNEVQEAAVHETPELAARIPFEYGKLLPGQSATRTMSLEGGPTLFATQWQTGTIITSLIDPSNQVIDQVYSTNNPSTVIYDTYGNLATYYLPNASAGIWKLILQATDLPADGSTYTTFAAFDSSVIMTTGIESAEYSVGEIAVITATLIGSPVNAEITATILRTDSITDTISLSPLGLGQYRGTYLVPNSPGYLQVRLSANGNVANGNSFERGKDLLFKVATVSEAMNKVYLPVIYH